MDWSVTGFNTIIPWKIFDNLSESVCFWILDFLLLCLQRVRFNDYLLNILVLSIGTPQVCLSPFLSCLFANDSISAC